MNSFEEKINYCIDAGKSYLAKNHLSNISKEDFIKVKESYKVISDELYNLFDNLFDWSKDDLDNLLNMLYGWKGVRVDSFSNMLKEWLVCYECDDDMDGFVFNEYITKFYDTSNPDKIIEILSGKGIDYIGYCYESDLEDEFEDGDDWEDEYDYESEDNDKDKQTHIDASNEMIYWSGDMSTLYPMLISNDKLNEFVKLNEDEDLSDFIEVYNFGMYASTVGSVSSIDFRIANKSEDLNFKGDIKDFSIYFLMEDLSCNTWYHSDKRNLRRLSNVLTAWYFFKASDIVIENKIKNLTL